MRKRQILQIGDDNWSARMDISSQNFDWFFSDSSLPSIITEKDLKKTSIFLFSSQSSLEFLPEYFSYISPYYVLYDANLELSEKQKYLLSRKKAFAFDMQDHKKVFEVLDAYFMSPKGGSRFPVEQIDFEPKYLSSTYKGHEKVAIDSDFGDDYKEIARWSFGLTFHPGQKMKFMPLISSFGKVEIRFNVFEIGLGGSEIVNKQFFDLSDHEEPFIFNNKNDAGVLSFSLSARGKGRIEIGPLHYRDSEEPFGEFIPGGQRIVDHNGQELFFYFNPGDLKPPLNVYFAGYRTLENFEGYPMMKSMQSPFILISDPRLEGGAFYRGSSELENKLVDQIKKSLVWLGFDNSQMIMSGLSMGSFGALYYGAELLPDAIIVGKPLTEIKEIAGNEKYLRPKEFSTSLDIFHYISELSDKEADQVFWQMIEKADFSKTKIAISYMINDDYDTAGYKKCWSI